MIPSSILLVDDNQDAVYITKRAIAKCRTDCAIETAEDGDQALARLENGAPPSVIFLDHKLPGMSGIDLAKIIRSRKKTQYTPMIMLTSSTMDADVKAAYDAGANSFLYKSNDFSEFTEKLKAVLHYWIDLNVIPE